MILKPVRVIKAKKRGLGDIVANALAPAVAFSDRVLKTNLKGCEGCKKRQEKLNRFSL